MPYLPPTGFPISSLMFLLLFVLLLLQLFWMLSEKFCKTKVCSLFLKGLIWCGKRKDRKLEVHLWWATTLSIVELYWLEPCLKLLFINCCCCYVSSKFCFFLCKEVFKKRLDMTVTAMPSWHGDIQLKVGVYDLKRSFPTSLVLGICNNSW